MSEPLDLTPQSEALHLDWHAGIPARCKGDGCPGLAHCRAIEAAAAQRAREPLVVALNVALHVAHWRHKQRFVDCDIEVCQRGRAALSDATAREGER